jgi:hypothetical protein
LRALSKEALAQGELQLGSLPRPLRRSYRFILPPQTVLGSLVFFGPPGAGKSVLLMNYLQAWSQNGSAIILDPKGELYEYCARYFRKTYRLDFKTRNTRIAGTSCPIAEATKSTRT